MQTHQALLSISTHIVIFLTNIQAYSEHCANPACLKPFHILSPDIFRIGDMFKTLWSFDQVYSEPPPPIVRTVYSGIIQPNSGIFRTFWNLRIYRNLSHSESWNIQDPFIIASHPLFKTLSHLQKWVNFV